MLGTALIPPDGYELDGLIAATYSLDLPTALALPLAVVREGELAGESFEKAARIDIYEALGRLIPKYRVFCDPAGIYEPPRRRLRVLSLLDQVVVPVEMPPLGPRQPAFHPKFVLARFAKPKSRSRLRMVCMSRNLTSDQSFDISVMLEGEDTGAASKRQGTDRLANAIERMLTWSVRPRVADRSRPLVQNMARSVRRTRWHPPPEFSSCEFMPLGFEDAQRDPTLLRDDETRLLVVSPFLSAGRLERLTRREGGHILLSGDYALEQVGTRALEDFDAIHKLAGAQLHAKLYVAEGRRHTRWLVGSANATTAAVAGNGELLVELTGSKSKLRIDVLLGTEAGIGDMLIEHQVSVEDPIDPQPETRHQAEEALRSLTRHSFRGVVTEASDDSYFVRIYAEVTESVDFDVRGRLAGTDTWTPLRFDHSPIVELVGVQRGDLSPFLVLSVDLEDPPLVCVVVMELDGIDLDELAKEGLREAVVDPLAYLAYLVGGMATETALTLTFEEDDPAELAAAAETAETFPSSPRPEPVLLEKLLQLLASDDISKLHRFDHIGNVIETLGAELPPDVLQLWETLAVARARALR